MAVASSKGRAQRARPFAQRSALRGFWENFKALLSALVFFIFLRTFIVEAYRIPSGSMIPTLLVGDWLFVNKLVYGPHVPFTNSRLPGYHDPRRGDVVVFKSPPQSDQPWDPNPTLVKRLVGMPGDTIYMRKGILFVNGAKAKENFPPSSSDQVFDSTDPLFDWQKKSGLASSRFGAAPAQPTHDNWGPLVVPPGHYFMMGDSRYNSKDSRYWSFVPRENIRGQPMFVYYAYNADDSDRPLPFLTDIRWGRIGHWIR
ncbi:MAG TPA: signal peptidase I [Gemmatimonadaceae bacterium]|nr:signal peptidase I [Gemmatimonadaceae bacterium]